MRENPAQDHFQSYQEFLSKLLNLLTEVKQPNLNLESVQTKWKQVQQVFNEEIISLTEENLDREIASRWQSVQTEMYRSYRLLQTEIIFLASARQPITLKQRQQSLIHNLEKIISYCQIILEHRFSNPQNGDFP